jgi:hypothetical protein
MKISGLEKDVVAKECRLLHDEELCDLGGIASILKVVKCRKV